MQNRGNKLLLGFLVFSLLILLVSMVYRENPSTGLREEKVDKEKPSASLNGEQVNKENSPTDLGEEQVNKENPPVGLSEDLLNMNPNAILDHLSAGTKAVGQRKISLESYDLKVETATHWKLPGRLYEISGLAMTLDNRLMAHNDEKAVIYEIDYRHGEIVKAFQLADMKDPVNGDFEGIAIVNDQVYLVTSSGRIYEGNRGTDAESVLYNSYTTGIGRDYEIEGLAYDASQQALLLMSKGSRKADLKEQLVLYRWSLDKKQLIEDAHIVIPVIEFTRHIKGKEFQPSGIERHPVSGNYFVIAARQGAIAEVTPWGQVVAARQFPAQWHRQPEGITFTTDGTLIIADEGSGKKARLTLYPVSENR
ncbi:MAG: hypothetical protein OXH00_23835 [Candidatus Poribacteria bacterium]|nr:hypothetical protein [Candidatus Poribacteria bacterium]